jgi:hypothetical protein
MPSSPSECVLVTAGIARRNGQENANTMLFERTMAGSNRDTVTAAAIVEVCSSLHQTGAELVRVLESTADHEDYRPDAKHWSFREIAAHLEACELECILVRVRQIAANAQPKFEFYDNEGWDFSDRELGTSLRAFNESRKRVIDFARSLTAEQLLRTGEHRTFGRITVGDYLRINLSHDREHLEDLKQMASAFAAQS